MFELLLIAVAHAQEAVPVVAPVVQPSLLVKLQAILSGNLEWVVAIGAIVLELGMRVFKTTKPQSILYYIANGLKLVADICTKLAEVLDKVLQRIKGPNS